MGNKNKTKTMNWVIVLAVVAIIALAGAVFKLSGDGGEATGQVTKEIIESSGDAQFCANNPTLDGQIRIQDVLQTNSIAYLNGTILVKNLDTGSITEQSITSGGTSAFTTLSNVFDCKSEKGYEIYVKADGSLNSDGKIMVTPEMLSRDPVEITLKASEYTPFKVKAYDNVDKSKVYSSTGSQDYVTTLTSTFNASGTAWATTADEAIDVTFTLQPNVSSDAKGEGLLIGINTEDESNLADFDESLLQAWWNGVELVEASGLAENELRAMNSYEKIYLIDDETIGAKMVDSELVKKVESTLRVYLQTESGQTKTFDPVIKIVALGDYQSQKDPKEILENVGFKDDSSRTELYNAQTITMVVGAVGANS